MVNKQTYLAPELGNLATKPEWMFKLDAWSKRRLGRRMLHITPRYVLDRATVWAFERSHPEAPWLTADAIAMLEDALKSTDHGLEWGSGRSTAWFARRTASLISVETSRSWFERVTTQLRERGIINVSYKLVPITDTVDDASVRALVEVDPSLARESLDYVLVDGAVARDQCALRAIELVKPGGLLIVDNVNWFVPHATRSPYSAVTLSPEWNEFVTRLKDWRMIWTSNGISDTAMWFRRA